MDVPSVCDSSPGSRPCGRQPTSGDDYCHGMPGEAAWSPDVLIELLDGQGTSAVVQYAVVVDAKYTARIRDHHWLDTAKYLSIRATRTRRQVVKQLWLAWPDERAGIAPRDSAVLWTRDGPDCPRNETVRAFSGPCRRRAYRTTPARTRAGSALRYRP